MPEMDSLAYIWSPLPPSRERLPGLSPAGRERAHGRVRALGRAQEPGAPRRIVFYVIAVTAFLSAFIPNAITVLAVLPVVTALDREHGRRHPGAPLTTALALATMYGANIGGMASLIGSPANLILLGVLDLYHVPGREQITFFNWFRC